MPQVLHTCLEWLVDWHPVQTQLRTGCCLSCGTRVPIQCQLPDGSLRHSEVDGEGEECEEPEPVADQDFHCAMGSPMLQRETQSERRWLWEKFKA